MKKFLLLAIIICLTSCNHFFHSSHYHLELVNAKKAVPTKLKMRTSDFHNTEATPVDLNLIAQNSNDSSSLSLLPEPKGEPTFLFHHHEADSLVSIPQIFSRDEKLKQEIKPDDDQNENEERKWNKAAVWAFILAIAGLAILPLGIAVLFLGKTARRKFQIQPSLRGRGFLQIAEILAVLEIISFIIYLVAIIIAILIVFS